MVERLQVVILWAIGPISKDTPAVNITSECDSTAMPIVCLQYVSGTNGGSSMGLRDYAVTYVL